MAERLTQKQRRELTRQQLLDAAAVVFSARGYHVASIDDIADAAGFTKGAVYSNFASKEDLFLALIRERQAQNGKAGRRLSASGRTRSFYS